MHVYKQSKRHIQSMQMSLAMWRLSSRYMNGEDALLYNVIRIVPKTAQIIGKYWFGGLRRKEEPRKHDCVKMQWLF